jgi:Na+-driven multidrug efflux pump
LTGQYLGLGDPVRARQATHYCWLLATVVMGSLGILFFSFPEMLVRLVTSEPRLMEITPAPLRICGPAQIFLGTAMILDQSIRGAGDTRPAMVIVTASTFLLRVPAAYLIGVHFWGGVAGIWLAICVEIAIRAAVLAAYYASGRWSRVVV